MFPVALTAQELVDFENGTVADAEVLNQNLHVLMDEIIRLKERVLALEPKTDFGSKYDASLIQSGFLILDDDGLTTAFSDGGFDWVRVADSINQGNHYWEVSVACGPDTAGLAMGVIDALAAPPTDQLDHEFEWIIGTDGTRKIHGGQSTTFMDSFVDTVAGDIFQIAVDLNGKHIFFGKNGIWLGDADPSQGSNPAFADLPSPVFAVMQGTNRECEPLTSTTNFGASDFTYSVPSGYFKGYCPTNDCEVAE